MGYWQSSVGQPAAGANLDYDQLSDYVQQPYQSAGDAGSWSVDPKRLPQKYDS